MHICIFLVQYEKNTGSLWGGKHHKLPEKNITPSAGCVWKKTATDQKKKHPKYSKRLKEKKEDL